jgi:cytochrome c oxidase subunit 1
VSAVVLGISMLIYLYNIVSSLLFARGPAPANQCGSLSMEWQLPSPVPVHNFERIPVFTSDPYGYGEQRTPVAVPAPSGAGGMS